MTDQQPDPRALDQAVRVLVREHLADPDAAAGLCEWDGRRHRADFGPGAEETVVRDGATGRVLYHARGQGGHVLTLEPGEWVGRTLAEADRLRKAQEARRASAGRLAGRAAPDAPVSDQGGGKGTGESHAPPPG